MESRPSSRRFEHILHLVAGAYGSAALQAGNIDGGIVRAGLCTGLIHDLPTCIELIERMVAECRARLGITAV